MNRHGSIPQHRLRSGGGNCYEFRFTWFRIDDTVLKVPEMTFDNFVEYFIITDCGL